MVLHALQTEERAFSLKEEGEAMEGACSALEVALQQVEGAVRGWDGAVVLNALHKEGRASSLKEEGVVMEGACSALEVALQEVEVALQEVGGAAHRVDGATVASSFAAHRNTCLGNSGKEDAACTALEAEIALQELEVALHEVEGAARGCGSAAADFFEAHNLSHPEVEAHNLFRLEGEMALEGACSALEVALHEWLPTAAAIEEERG